MAGISRRGFVAGAALLSGCASGPQLRSQSQAQGREPIVFVHGNGDNASIWQTVLWRFESNGWPHERLFPLNQPYPLARDDDTRPQAGRSSTAEHMAFIRAEVDRVLRITGAKQVVIVANSRGANGVRNYIDNGGGSAKVSHAILCGGTNHGVWGVHMPGFPDTSEFAGHGPFMTMLNRPKDAAGDEVAGPVKWLTIRSDGNDKYAQPEGTWIGKRGVPTGLTHAAPELKGATNVVLPRVDHRETAFSPAAFAAMYRFITGEAPRTVEIVSDRAVALNGVVDNAENWPIAGATVEVYAIDPATGERASAVHRKVTGPEGVWGFFSGRSDQRYEFIVSAPGYAVTHYYRSPFPRSTEVLNFRPERIAEADKAAKAIVLMTRPRGYFDPARDRMSFDGHSPPPGALPGAGVSTSKIKLDTDAARPIVAEFNGERVIGRTWPAARNQVTVLELTY
jgi:pimeloyl-ACP methyl ester carboxylesterase